MGEEQLSQARLDGLWREVQQAVIDSAWSEAEGLLRRFIQLVPSSPVDVWDTLGYALLMQGDYQNCLAVLSPWQAHPSRSFWVNHKLGDALRGLNDLEGAVVAYRQSLADGSDQFLTWRNLLQCLDEIAPELAVDELERAMVLPQGPPPEAWEGARAAALIVPGAGLAEQLWRWGQADAACRRRLLDAALYALNLPKALAVLDKAETTNDLSPWEHCLLQRLHRLGVID